MGAKSGATKAQVAQGLARAGGKSAYNVTNKDIKRAGKAAKIISGAVVTTLGPGKVVKGVKAASKVIKTVKAAKAANKTKPTQASRITAQQKATTTSKTRASALEKQIKDIETRMKANSARAAELAKRPKSPGAPSDREMGLLDANKSLAADLRKIRQSYTDLKTPGL